MSPEKQKANNITIMNLFMSLGFCIGPLITFFWVSLSPDSKIVDDTVYYFAFPLILMLICLLLAKFLLPEDMNFDKSKTINLPNTKNIRSYIYIFKDRSILNLTVAYFLLSCSFSAFIATVPLIFELYYNHCTKTNASIFLFLGMGYLASSLLLYKIFARAISSINSYLVYTLIGGSIMIALQLIYNKFISFVLIFLYGVFEITCYNWIMLQVTGRDSTDRTKLIASFSIIMCLASLTSSCFVPILFSFDINLPLNVAALFMVMSGFIIMLDQRTKPRHRY